MLSNSSLKTHDLRWSISAVAAEFINRSVFVTCVLVGALLYFISDLIPTVNYSQVFFGLTVGTVFFARTIKNGWLDDERFEQLLVYPFRERTLVIAFVLLATGVFLLEAGIPMLVFLLTAGQGSRILLAVLMVYLVLVAALIFAASALPWKYAGLTSYSLPILIGVLAQYVSPWFGIALVIFCLIVVFRFALVIPRAYKAEELRVVTFIRCKTKNYFLANGLLDPRAWSSFFLINVFAVLIAYVIGQEQGPIKIFWILALVNTPMTTILSREKDTLEQVRLLGDEWKTAIRLGKVIFPIFILGIAFQWAVAAWWGLWTPLDIIFGLCIALIGTVLSVWLEFKFPLTNTKSERDVFRHPRKYLPVLFCGVLMFLYELATGNAV
ncbi:hypothetical protein [Corynebacterium freiburgense]|uniref:hypothetical protein n=1 Tax=Corynebacterium freiburgense TaxID=556548 RepID=UPI0004035582|nr:hypothetical protein [Corynebacterium freiburgense]WJZ03423.1 hypothetical protein CFREI_10755 [Corynebacterium freiburgense]